MKSAKNILEKAEVMPQDILKINKSVASPKTSGKAAPVKTSKLPKRKELTITANTAGNDPVKKTAAKKNEIKKTIKNAAKFDKKITDKLKRIVSNYTEYPELLNSIERDTTKSFIDELNIDSVDFVEIIVDVEQAFDITIEDDEIYDLKSFEDLYFAIETKIKGTSKK